jgi:glutamine amidotransferase
MIAIVDYGLGNVQAFQNVYKRLNLEATRVTTPAELTGATHVILPGVGAFDHAMERLARSGMREALDDLVLRGSVPVLGVCVGMQILASSSEEGVLRGLNWIDGRVRKFGADGTAVPRLPHMGWNDVRTTTAHPLFTGLETDARFYFLHSYYFECARSEDVAAVADYGFEFGSAVSAGNVHGVQFHPEKSHHYGIRLLKNFAEL